MQSLNQWLLLSFFYFNDFLHFNITLMIGVFFSYLFVPSLRQNTWKSSAAIAGKFHPRSGMYYRGKNIRCLLSASFMM